MSSAISIDKATLPELRAKLKTLGPAYARMKAQAAHANEMVVPALATTAGGAVAGYLAVKHPTVPGTDGKLPSDGILGLLCVGAAALGWGGKHNELLSSFGGGLGAVYASRTVEHMLNKA